MEFLTKIRDFIQDLEERDFYRYLVGLLVILAIIIGFMVFRYYKNVNYYENRIDEINEQRETEVRDLLTRFEVVKKQREDVDKMLKKEEDFKIIAYLNDVLKKLRLSEYKKDENVTTKELDQYRKSELAARFVGMNMKQLCELLKELESKERIGIRLLEIRRSKKKRDAIDVDITISTLLPKAQ